MNAIAEKKKGTFVVTPVGRFSFPTLVEPSVFVNPKTGEKDYSQGTNFLIYQSTLESNPQERAFFEGLKNAVLSVGKDYFNNPNLTLKDFKNPFNPAKMTDSDPKITDPDMKGAIVIRPKYHRDESKGKLRPVFLGPDKKELSIEDAKKIKGGDWGRLSVGIYGYNFKGNTGVSMSISVVQFWKSGKAFGGGGVEKSIAMLTEMEIPLSDAPDGVGLMDAASKLF